MGSCWIGVVYDPLCRKNPGGYQLPPPRRLHHRRRPRNPAPALEDSGATCEAKPEPKELPSKALWVTAPAK